MDNDQMSALAAKVAPLIRGGRFRFNEVLTEIHGRRGYGSDVILSNDAAPCERIRISNAWQQRGRLAITGMVPDSYAGVAESGKRWTGYRASSITVADNRSPQGIAGDIVRRLLPDYRAHLAKTLQDLAQREAAESAFQNRLNCFRNVCDSVEPWHYERDKYTFKAQGADGQLTHNYDGSWTIQVRVPFDFAVRALAWLHAQAPAQKEEEPDD